MKEEVLKSYNTNYTERISEIDQSCKHTWKHHSKKGWFFYSETLWCPKCGSWKKIH